MWNCNNPYAYRDQNLMRLGFRSYRDYLKSPLWASIRKRATQRARHRCERCSSTRCLQVHHRAYDMATLAGDNIDSLTVACRSCHCKAERPGDFKRTRYDRVQESSELLMTSTPDMRELIVQWYRANKRNGLPSLATVDEQVALFGAIRARATQLDDRKRCLACGRNNTNPRVEPKRLSVGYEFCGQHSWGHIRACMSALALWRRAEHVA